MNERFATRRIRHRGRIEQVGIYFVKLIRLFVYQNDWKVLPMAVVIAGLVSLVVKNDFFVTMEGTLKGALALSCVAIWNGFFNSIQVVCREREIVKKEHRSGMHISSYILAHMLYQALICLIQTVLTIYTCKLMGVKFPKEGLLTSWMMVDIGVTVFLISYSADMVSLWISTLVHNTTTAMSIMPFILIAQLVFSGGIFQLPAWSNSISRFMISNYGVRCIAAQADYNSRPTLTAWNTLAKLEKNELGGTYTLGQILDAPGDQNSSPRVQPRREKEIGKLMTTGEIKKVLSDSKAVEVIKQTNVFDNYTIGNVMDILHVDNLMDLFSDVEVGTTVKVGDILDKILSNKLLQAERDRKINLKITIGELIDLLGREDIEYYLKYRTAKVVQKSAYDHTEENIESMWLSFVMFILFFASLSIICLEFIDRDKR